VQPFERAARRGRAVLLILFRHAQPLGQQRQILHERRALLGPNPPDAAVLAGMTVAILGRQGRFPHPAQARNRLRHRGGLPAAQGTVERL